MIFLIASTGTDIGKTFVLEKLCQKFINEGKNIEAIKPIISGFEDENKNSDSAKILNILGKDFNKNNLDEISPYRFSAPLSPNIAAQLENKEINFEELINFCQRKISDSKKNNSHLLIEGAGGIMTPITNQKTFLDLMDELKIPVILVIGNYLGTISHTLTAIETLKSRHIKIDRIIFNAKDKDIDASQTLKTLRKFIDIQIDEI